MMKKNDKVDLATGNISEVFFLSGSIQCNLWSEVMVIAFSNISLFIR